MKQWKTLHRIALVIAVLWSATGCGDSATAPEPETPFAATYKVKYADNAVVLTGDAASALLDVDTAAAQYAFDAGKLEQSGVVFQPGTVFVVEHRAMRKVSSVRREGNRIIVETEDATLPELIPNGTIAWDFIPELTAGGSIGLKDDQGRVLVQPMDMAEFTFPITREISRGDYTYTMTFNGQMESGKIRAIDVEFAVKKKINGQAAASFSGKGTFHIPRNSASMVMENGKLTSFSTNNKGMVCDIEVAIAAAGAGYGDMDLKLPNAALSIPIRAIPTPAGPVPIPIPVSIDIGVQFVAKLSVSGEASAVAKSSFSYSGEGGFEYKGTSIEPKASVGKAEAKPGEADAASFFNPVDAQFGIAIPRVSLNIAGSEVAAVYCGFSVGASLNFGPVCKRAYVKIVKEGSYDLKILGVSVLQGKKEFFSKIHEAKGEGCP